MTRAGGTPMKMLGLAVIFVLIAVTLLPLSGRCQQNDLWAMEKPYLAPCPDAWIEPFDKSSAYWYVLGNAEWDDVNKWFVLTPCAAERSGRLFWLCKKPMNGWTAQFDFYAGGGGGMGGGADGLTFAFCKAYNYPRSYGGWLDFNGASGYAVEFDTFHNWGGSTDPTDPPTTSDHIAILENDADHYLCYAAIPDIEDTLWHHVSIQFRYGWITVWLDGMRYIFYQIPDYESYSGYFGFTAATWSGWNWHKIDNVRVQILSQAKETAVSPAVPALSLFGVLALVLALGAVVLILMRRRLRTESR